MSSSLSPPDWSPQSIVLGQGSSCKYFLHKGSSIKSQLWPPKIPKTPKPIETLHLSSPRRLSRSTSTLVANIA